MDKKKGIFWLPEVLRFLDFRFYSQSYFRVRNLYYGTQLNVKVTICDCQIRDHLLFDAKHRQVELPSVLSRRSHAASVLQWEAYKAKGGTPNP